MALNTFQGLMRSNGGGSKGVTTPAPLVMAVVISFNPTLSSATPVRIGSSATAGNIFTLPAGAVPISFTSLGGATGGASPTVDIGTAASTAGFFDEADADTKGVVTAANGALVVATGTTTDLVVTGKVGASAAAGGTTTGIFTYTMYNDGFEY